jgi:hypothetical protein
VMKIMKLIETIFLASVRIKLFPANNNCIASRNFLKSYTYSSVLSNIFLETHKILYSSKLQFI